MRRGRSLPGPASSIPSVLSPSYTGQLAALGAATCWAFSALSFETAGKRIGALTLNLIRLVIAFGFLSVGAWIARGVPLPVDASPHAWLWLTVSGLVGFVFGDLCLFRAFLLIGSRLSMLLMSLAPVLTAVIGWLVLGETLTGRDLVGMILTVTGIAWAVLERKKQSSSEAGGASLPHRAPLAGIALGVGGALGQAGGLVLSKLGMGSYHAFAATQIRVIAGMAGYVVLYFALRWWSRVWPALRDTPALGFASIGAFFGPFLGVSLSLIAVRHTVAGVAASIMALTPVLIIPLTVFLRREKVGLGGVLGAMVAVAGVAILFL